MNQIPQSNQNYLSPMFVPMKPLNLNLGTPKLCEKHKKPLSFYNKYKPEKEPVCIDCLTDDVKELNTPNLYLPYSNLEQDYYFQKKSLIQIIEQANNIKKYEKHIINFQQLLIRYFSQFITKFIKEKIFHTMNGNKKENDVLEKVNNSPTNSSQDIMNALNKFESEKFILENKCADVFCQINKLQTIFLKNHAKIETYFKDLLSECFEENDECNLNSNEKSHLSQNNFTHCKTQSNKKNPNLMNCVNIQNEYISSSNSSAPCNSININQDSMSNSRSTKKSPQNNPINQFSSNGKCDIKINENKNIPSNININMEKERIFEESPKSKIEKGINSSPESDKNSDVNFNSSPEKNYSNMNREVPSRKEEDNLIYRSHKEKINNLIEKDKNKKTNQSFYQSKKPNMRKRSKLNNKPFQRYKPKYGQRKKVEYKRYNQFITKNCRKCGNSFPTLENSGKDDCYCQNCRPKSVEDDEPGNRNINKRDSSFKRDRNDFGKYSYNPKNFNSHKKKYGPPSSTTSHYWNKGKGGFNKIKKDLSFNSHRFGSKSLHHSSSNFLSRHNNRMTSPKPFGRPKKFGLNNPNPKFKQNSDKENYGIKKYNEENLNDDFEVELNSVEENNNNSEEESEQRKEKSFSKTTNEFFKNKSEGDQSNDSKNNADDDDNDHDNDNDNEDDKNDMEDDNDEIKENEDNDDEGDNGSDDDFDVDF